MAKRKRKRRRLRFQLRTMLRRRNMSLGELGRRTGIARSTLSVLRKGEQLPTLDTLAIIAEELECTCEDLLPGIGTRKGAARA